MDILLPKIALTMTSGVIEEWHVTVGQTVRKGDLLFTFETDKTSVDVEAQAAGVVRRIMAEPGSEVAAGTVVGELAAEDERPAPTAARPTMEVSIAPAAAELAEVLGVDLGSLTGSGTGGRIVEADVIAASEAPRSPRASTAAAPSPAGPAGPATTPLDFSPARRASWATLERSASVPTFRLGGSLKIGRLDEIRAAGVSVLDVIALAAARALADHPTCHARVRDGVPETFAAAQIGILVRHEDGLYTPSFAILAEDTASSLGLRRREAQRALAEGRLPAANSVAPTFVISNLGQFDVDWFSAMLYPDTAVTMALGSMGVGGRRPNELAVVLTCDHRLADGVDAARFLADVRELVDSIPLAGKERA